MAAVTMPGRTLTRAMLLLMTLLLAGYGRAAQRYPAKGLVLNVDRPNRTLVVSCQDIPGYMDAMVMPFTVREAKTLGGLAGATAMALYLLARRGPVAFRDTGRALVPFAPAGLVWGASYATLFEAFYRGRVTVVSPLVATESLFGVLFAVLIVGRSELVGKHLVLGALLIVGGGVLIGALR